MEKYLVKARVMQTAYFDYDGDGFSTDSPKQSYDWYKLGEDYYILKTGTILYFRKDEDCCNKFIYYGETKGSGNGIRFETIEDILECSFLEILEY
jgi:hypothetical protein